MQNTRRLLLSLLILSSLLIHAQVDDSWKLYDDSHVARIDVTIDTLALDWIYNNVQSDSEHVAFFRFRNNWIDETVDSIGFRLRGNTSRESKKKSFKVSFNTFHKGRDFHNVEKLNLNGEHNDPSIIRSKLCFDHFESINFKASRANHVAFYINGDYYGLYINVEHIDEEFLKKNFNDDSGNLWKCLYPADLVYMGDDPSVYKNLNSNGRPAYELSTNKQQMDFTKLVRLISIINNTASNILPDSLECTIDVSEVLKYFAMNVLMGSWDDYWSLMNNYYLYHEPATDMFHIIPYDYDNTYGIDWFNINWTAADPYNFPKIVGGARPLAEKLLANSQYRNLYTHFIQFIRDNVYSLNLWESHIDSIKQIITPQAISDPYRALDYGFTSSDFFNSYSAVDYSNQHVKYGLKQFVNLRNNSTFSQLSYQSAKPIAYKIIYEPLNPNPTDSIWVYVSAFSNVGLSEVSIQFTRSGASTKDIYQMEFSPIPNTKIVDEADRYIGIIPPLGIGGSGMFSIYVKDTQNEFQFYPRKSPISIASAMPTGNSIVINEFLADNVSSVSDLNGEHDDWIELYNPTLEPILLSGKYLSDNPVNLTKWEFTQPSLYLNPGGFLVVWCDEDLNQTGLHSNFKLSKSGEFIALVDTDGVSILDSLFFGSQKIDTSYGRFPDGSSEWYFLSPTPGGGNIVLSVNDDYIPTDFRVFQNYPNPFNPWTTIHYQIPIESYVSLKIYDILGNVVASLVNEVKSAGIYKVNFNASELSSGIYFYKLNAGNYTETKKMILLR